MTTSSRAGTFAHQGVSHRLFLAGLMGLLATVPASGQIVLPETVLVKEGDTAVVCNEDSMGWKNMEDALLDNPGRRIKLPWLLIVKVKKVVKTSDHFVVGGRIYPWPQYNVEVSGGGETYVSGRYAFRRVTDLPYLKSVYKDLTAVELIPPKSRTKFRAAERQIGNVCKRLGVSTADGLWALRIGLANDWPVGQKKKFKVK